MLSPGTLRRKIDQTTQRIYAGNLNGFIRQHVVERILQVVFLGFLLLVFIHQSIVQSAFVSY